MGKRESTSSVGHYLSPLVYGANDGIITTFAVISGAAGATLGSDVMVILGIASLFADGFSMGVSSFLSMKSQQEYENDNHLAEEKSHHSPLKHGVATFLAFVAAGALPLIPFLILDPVGNTQFIVSAISTAFAFFLVGSLRSYLLPKRWWWAGFEMLVIGGGAATIAFSIGWATRTFLV